MKNVVLMLCFAAALASQEIEWTPARCNIYGGSIALELKDSLQELRFYACQTRVTKVAKENGWDNNCSNIALHSCITELGRSK